MQNATAIPSDEAISLDRIRALVSSDLEALESTICQCLQSDIEVINQVSRHITQAGGKRLRPMLLLLAARACQCTNQHPIILSTVIEYVHTATLLHDDVVDASRLRRNQATAHTRWGNEISILVGDFLYARAFQLIVELQHLPVMSILAQATAIIAEGEAFQLSNRYQPAMTEADYFRIIRAKTGKLFECAAQFAAAISNQPQPIEHALATYGMQLGIAFQLIDDVLDYSAPAEIMGKNIGDDLAQGYTTLPLITVLQRGTADEVQLIRTTLQQGRIEALDEVRSAIASTDAIAYTAALAHQHVDRAVDALSVLPASPYRDGLVQLARFVTQRSH